MNVITSSWMQDHDNVLVSKLKPLADAQIVKTLSTIPTSSTLTYVVDGVSHSYKIGDEVRVADNTADNGYSYYKLYTINDNSAVWAKEGTGGGYENILGTLRITLEPIIYNSANTSGVVGNANLLNGTRVTITDSEDSEVTQYLDWAGSELVFSNLVPGKTYNVTISNLPDAFILTDNSLPSVTIGLGSNIPRTIHFGQDEYSVSVASNQDTQYTKDSRVASAGAVYNNVTYTDGQYIRVAHGTTIAVTGETGANVTNTDMTNSAYAGSISRSGYAITINYYTEKIIVNVTAINKAEENVAADGATITIGNNTYTLESGHTNITYDDTTLTWIVIDYIAFGQSYGISATGLEGYFDPGQIFNESGDKTTETFNLQFEEGDYVDLGLPSGLLWAKGNLCKDSNDNYYLGEPTDKGVYVSWGNIFGYNKGETYDFSDANYQSTTGYSLTGDIPKNAQYDIVLAKLDSYFRIPSLNEFQELIDNTDFERVSGGVKFMKKTDHNVYIFLPLSGYRTGTSHSFENLRGYYTSTKYKSSVYYLSLYFSTGENPKTDSDNTVNRRNGMPIRPVMTRRTNINITLNETDNTDASGKTVTVTDSEGATHTGTANANGQVTMQNVAYGACTVNVADYVLTNNSITVSASAKSFTLDCKYEPVGVWIYTTDGQYISSSNWSGTGKTLNDVVGIAVKSDSNKFVISPDNISRCNLSGAQGNVPTGMTEHSTQENGLLDFSGEGNTDTLMDISTYNTSDYAAYKARNYTFKSVNNAQGKSGYLPSLGELNLAYLNKTEIDACLSACGGTAFSIDTYYYWSSTYRYKSSTMYTFWRLLWTDGTISSAHVATSQYVRPFCQL